MAYIGNSPANVGGYQIVDDISASFDGSTTSFALTASSSTITPVKTGQLLVGLNGVMQEPDDTGTDGFKVSGSNIIFSSAPASGDTFWAVYQGQNVDVGTPSAGTVGAAELKDDSVTNIKMADDAIGVAELSATGTANTSVYLRGDNSWSAVTHTPEGSDVLSTGESTTTKYLRTDGDGSSSWQALGDASVTSLTVTGGITEGQTTKSASFTPDLSNDGTLYSCSGTMTITMPTAESGKSFTIIHATATSITWAGTIKWNGGSAPTADSGIDIYVFVSDGTNWYGMQSGTGFA